MSGDRAGSAVALVADVGRTSMRIGLTDGAGRLRRDSVRSYDPGEQSTLSGAISTFRRDSGLLALPMGWLLLVYLVPLSLLFVTAFWGTDSFTGRVVRETAAFIRTCSSGATEAAGEYRT